MDVSIIIVNYNTKDLTLQCINSVYEKTQGISFEVILVDNASTDGSKEHFQEDNRITYIYSDENLGFGRANNLGLKYAKGRNILFLNSDTVLVNNAIKILSNYIDNNLDVGACGGNLYTKDLNPNYSYEMFFPSITKEIDRFFCKIPSYILYGKNATHNYLNKPIKVKSICGADMMVRTHVLNVAGVFNESFFMYAEETELCHRIVRHNYKIHSVPDAKIIHFDGGSFNTNNDTEKEYARLKMRYQSKFLYYTITYSKHYTKTAFFIWKLTCISRLFVYKFLKSSKLKFWKREYDIFRELKMSM